MILIDKSIKKSLKIELCGDCHNRNFEDIYPKLIKYSTVVTIVTPSDKQCYICCNLFSKTLPLIVAQIKNELLSGSQHVNTIDIGTKIPSKLFENEDFIRSLFSIKGKPSIKIQINNEIRKQINMFKNVEIDHINPECKFEITIHDNLEFTIVISNREHYLLGSYKKMRRGIAQKDPLSHNPSLVSANLNNLNHCSDSIESFINEIVKSQFNADKVKIIWTGSEDKNSLVKGNGRPFLVKADIGSHCPDKDKIYERNGIEITFQRTRSDTIQNLHRYRQDVLLLIQIKADDDPRDDLESLIEKFVGEIRFKLNNKSIIRNIYSSRLIQRKSNNLLEIQLRMDNGIPIKQLIGGLEPIEPSFSKHVEAPCECIYFDIIEVFQSS